VPGLLERPLAVGVLILVAPLVVPLLFGSLFLFPAALVELAVAVVTILGSPSTLLRAGGAGVALGQAVAFAGGCFGLAALVVPALRAVPPRWVGFGLLAGVLALLSAGAVPASAQARLTLFQVSTCLVPAAAATWLAWRVLDLHRDPLRWCVPWVVVAVGAGAIVAGRFASSAWYPLDPVVTTQALQRYVDAAFACGRTFPGSDPCALDGAVLRVEYVAPHLDPRPASEDAGAGRCIRGRRLHGTRVLDRVPASARIGSAVSDRRDPKEPGLGILRGSVHEEGRGRPRRILHLWACGEGADETVEGLVLLLDYETLVSGLRAEAPVDAG
jgi:hypothetical protein